MLRPTISIDLGASYTKVAYRKPLSRREGQRFASANTEIALIERTAMIPSLMVQTGDRRRPWIAGMDAAGMTPDKNMKVFANWKSALYSSNFDANKVDLVWVAGHFFKWLRERLEKCGVDFDNECRVRVTIPALKRIEEQKEALIRCMKLNGWPDEIGVVIEPVANIIGVLSGGRNVVSATGNISYQPTFGDADGTGQRELNYVFGEMRKFALQTRQERHMKLSVVDFGSFTLDIANMNLDMKVTDPVKFPTQEISAYSWEIGVIEDIDRPCFAELFGRNSIDGDRLSFRIKEETKAALYTGEAYALAIQRGRITLGETDRDKATVDSAITGYCEKAWSMIADHCNGSEVVILTGGGTCIRRVRDYFHKKLRQKRVTNIVNFSVNEATTIGQDQDNCFCEWHSTGEGIGRLATGLGGASIGLGFEPDEECRRFVRVPSPRLP